MQTRATNRKVKCSFTLTNDSVAFVRETRRQRQAASDSEALDLLLREAMLARKQEEINAAVKAYYDSASEEELQEQLEWAELSGPNLFAGVRE